ncbi:MAG: DUF2721 domain-containing protein [Rhodocyclaceae bacterium]|nr:MAG: DUF2721 domain-containing protein [Rhodocyclaceae bacterium]
MESHISEIARVIQLAVAPVFLLTAIATLVATLNNRLGRIVDRRRALLERPIENRFAEEANTTRIELALLSRRVRLIYLAIFSAVLGALFICLVVASAFLAALISYDLSRLVAGLFILSMLALVVALSLFLREVYLAVSHSTHANR